MVRTRVLHGIKQEHGKNIDIRSENLQKLCREDKKLKTNILKEYFQKLLVDTKLPIKSGEVILSEIDTLTGEVKTSKQLSLHLQASVVMVRGKKRMGYELEIKIKFKGAGAWEGIQGMLEYTEVCDDGSEGDTKMFV